jgi:biotin synthase
MVNAVLDENLSPLTRVEALELVALPGPDQAEQLVERAWPVRRASFGNRVRLCAISNAKSGRCAEQCDFCAQSAHFSTAAPAFPMRPARQIADDARRAQEAGAREFSIVTSGRALRKDHEIAEVEGAVRLMAGETRLEPCASLGELPTEVLLRLREAGLKRYHHNIETAPSFHSRIVHTHRFEDEVRTVRQAKEAGLLVCCGGILGMGETPAQRVEMAFALGEMEPDCVPLNFLDPRPGTPLAGRQELTPLDCLAIIALFRLVLPRTHIFVCGGRERNLGPLQHRMFRAGATGTMVGDYLTTTGQSTAEDRCMIAGAGFEIEEPLP